MKVMVTGASGFIGRYLTQALIDSGHGVLSVGREPGAADTHPGATFASTDYSEDSVASLLGGVDAIVHLAGRRMTREDDPLLLAPFLEPNVVAAENILRAAKKAGVKNVVLASTIAVYSVGNDVPFNEDHISQPLNAYGLSKLMAEQVAAMHARGSSVRLTNLRFAAIYGHGEKGTPALMKFIGEAQAGRQLALQGNRLISIDELYVRDAVGAILAALSPSSPGGTFNIGSGTASSILEIAETVNAVFGNAGNLVLDGSHEAAVRKPFLNISRAAAGLGWKPLYDLRAGLADFLETSLKACDR